ncbi:hypothetical protein VPH35_108342 [Triticum aestivum]
MIEDDCADNGIPLPNVDSKILSKVIEYCKKHVQASPKLADSTDASSSTSTAAAAPAEDLKSFDAEFVNGLLDLTCQTVAVADMIKGKTPEEIRKTFNIKNDFTPEEEAEIRRENQWAFE